MALVTDVFNGNAWGVLEYQEQVVERVDYRPQLLGSLNLFEPIYSRSRAIAIAYRDRTMALIATSPDGSAPEELVPQDSDVRYFRTTRLAKGSTIYAAELASITALPFDVQTREVAQEVTRRTARITEDLELTWEHMRFGAVQGRVMDSDGVSVLYDWYSIWGIAEPVEIDFELDSPGTDVRKKCRDVGRTMQKAGKGVWTPSSRVVGLCGDEFFDALLNHPQIKETKLGTERAVTIENIEGYSSIEIENITFVNYRGTDDGATLAIAANRVRFFPMGARGAFQVGWGPANEFKPYLNRAGIEKYGLILSDPSGRDAWDRTEIYSYPIFICTRPEMLLRGRMA